MMKDTVILVDRNDQMIGQVEKLAAHINGYLHRAFSVFIFNSAGEILLQKRSSEKYHSGGLWSNTCCSHPRPGEDTEKAAKRRLFEEMGLESPLSPAFRFIYKSKLKNNLIEHELDHVYYGYTNQKPKLNKKEAEDYKFVRPEDLKKDIEKNPQDYTSWLKICLDSLINHVTQKKEKDEK